MKVASRSGDLAFPASKAGKVLIVGAGMTGVSAARRLREHGVEAVMVDKGYKPGGRMATRRLGGATFDHGAQHFSVRSESYGPIVRDLIEQNVVGEWFRPKSTGAQERVEPRLAGVTGMRPIVEHLAADLDVRTQIALDRLEVVPEGIVAWSGGEPVFAARAAILTTPVPQALDLLDAGHTEISAGVDAPLRDLTYHSCLTVMARMDGPSGLEEGHASFHDGPIAWMADNLHKGISETPAVTIQSSPAFASENLSSDPIGWSGELIRQASGILGSRVIESASHRWRYSTPTTTLGNGALRVSDGSPVILGGEAFVSARVEGAFLSGLAAADLLLDSGLLDGNR